MAQIDPSIALGVKPVQIESPINQLAKLYQMQGLQQQNALAGMQMEESRRGIEEQNALRDLFRSGADASTLRRSGFHKQALEWEDAEAKRKKATSESNAANLKLYRDSVNVLVADPRPETAAALLDDLERRTGENMGVYRQVFQQAGGDGARIREIAMRIGVELDKQLPTFQTRNTGGTTDTLSIDPVTQQVRVANSVKNTVSPDAALSAETQRRGQNMVDQRSREANAQGKTQIVETPQGFVIVDKNTGTSRPAVGADGQPLKGKANDRVMTDAQAKANLFGTRMKESDRILSELEGKYSPAAVASKMAAQDLPLVGGAAGAIGNLTMGASNQQAEQAQRDFINAVLRRESGAVISPQEFANARLQYFPEPGDTPQKLAQKARNRKLAISGMETEVPGGFRVGPSLSGTGTTESNPDIDALLKKYGGK